MKPNTEVVPVASGDPRMEKAIQTARASVGDFVAALQQPKPGQAGFAVKKAFPADGGNEHIWLNQVSFDGTSFHGRINNRPEKAAGVRIGDAATVTPEEVSDWMYVDGRKLVGGYTIRAIRDGLSPEGQKQFDQGAPFAVE